VTRFHQGSYFLTIAEAIRDDEAWDYSPLWILKVT
jgi:hypothetical protein